MQFLLINQDYGNYLRGEILVVKPDTHVWSALEVMSAWLASDAVAIAAGLPVEYRAPYIRNTGNFRNPQFSVCRFPSHRYDLNLAEPWLDSDGGGGSTVVIGNSLWYLDLDALPPGQRKSLEAPGGEGTLGANRLDAVKNKHDGLSLADMVDWDSDLTKGNTKHRHFSTNARNMLGVSQ